MTQTWLSQVAYVTGTAIFGTTVREKDGLRYDEVVDFGPISFEVFAPVVLIVWAQVHSVQQMMVWDLYVTKWL